MVEKSTNCVRFFRHWVKNNYQSEEQGRLVGEEVDYIEIRAAGDKLTAFQRPATSDDQIEYSREWDQYQRGEEQIAEGTPLREWPVMNEGTIAMLRSLNIHTIEVMAECSDAALLKIGTGARQLQTAAKTFLEQAPSRTANPPAESADLRVENERLAAKVAELETKTAEQREKIKRQAKKIAVLKPKKAA